MLVRVLLRPLVEKELLDLPVEQFLGSLRFEQGIPGSRKTMLGRDYKTSGWTGFEEQGANKLAKIGEEPVARLIRHSPEEMLEIIHLVDPSMLSVKRTLEELDVPWTIFYRWYRQYKGDGPDDDY